MASASRLPFLIIESPYPKGRQHRGKRALYDTGLAHFVGGIGIDDLTAAGQLWLGRAPIHQ